VKRRPLYGPPRPDPRAVELLDTIRTACDPGDVIAAVLELRDRLTIPTCVGGGLHGHRARQHAEDIIEALDSRSMLARQGALL
jgi:hypothetical protein